MANWLKRAQCEILRSVNRTTANSDERSLMAAMAVAEQAKPGNSRPSIGSNGSALDTILLESEEAVIRAWLDYIDETDCFAIAEVLNTCRTNNEARVYFLHRAEEVPSIPTFDDDRRYGTECTNLTPSGLCLAAWRGEIKASRTFYPMDHIPKRCDRYTPGPNDTDRRLGRERWRMFKHDENTHVGDRNQLYPSCALGYRPEILFPIVHNG